DQGRALAGKAALDGPSQLLPTIYGLPAQDFHDVTSGTSFGQPNLGAGPGYDLVTGRGTPVANLVVAHMVAAATTTTLSTSTATAVFGQPVTLTAAVTSAAGVPTGTVTFLDGNTVLGTAQVNAGQATLPVSLGVGNHALTASFAATGNFANSTSAAVAVTVNRAATAAALASSLNPAVTGQALTFTATVTAVAPGAGAPTGTVTFQDGNV